MFEPIKRDLHLSDAQLGWLGSAYIIVLSLAALPLLTAYARERRASRPVKRLYARRGAMMDRLVSEYQAAREFRDQRAEESLAHMHPGAGGAETVARR